MTANERLNPDLFWALKGGGPASFAVILSVTMKTFPDLPSAGATLYINTTHTFNQDVWWNGTAIFHKWSSFFVDQGLYVYFEVFPFTFRVRPFVAIGKTTAQLQTIVQPFLNELTAKGVPYEFAIKSFPTFYNLYVDLFEPEASGSSALTGGWMFNHNDVANNNNGIIDAFKTVMFPRADLVGLMVGHLFNPGYGAPQSNSATHPAWRNATDFIISILPVPDGASLAQKADLQNVLTNTMDAALRRASTSGCTYVNEVSHSQSALTDCVTNDESPGRPVPAQLAEPFLGLRVPEAPAPPREVGPPRCLLRGFNPRNRGVGSDRGRHAAVQETVVVRLCEDSTRSGLDTYRAN